MRWLRPRLQRPQRGVVYTCLFGSSEHFNDFDYGDAVERICFTDDPHLRAEHWKLQLVGRGLLDPVRRSKQYKLLAHRFLPDHAWSLYVDNTVRLKVEPQAFFEQQLADRPSAMRCFRHPDRDCVYDEAGAVLLEGYDDPRRVEAQMRFYRYLGLPEKAGLATLPVLLRRHHDARVIALAEAWFQQLLLFSFRDQLSFNPVAWSQAYEIDYFDRAFGDTTLLDWPVVKDGVRVPRDFDDVRYLELNPDVNFDPRRHYLHHGAGEGRRYK
jgi:hypothetical protein